MAKLTIIGAGFSGLTLARECLKQGLEVEVLERASRPGGIIGTVRTPAGIAETGAPSMNRTARMDAMIAEIKVKPLEPSKSSRKRLFYDGRLTSWPLGILATLALIFRFLWSRLTGRLRPRAGETVAEWGRRTLTRPTVSKLLGSALQGIYAGDVERMSASLTVGGMFRKNREKFHGVIGIEGGSQELIRGLAEDVLRRGGVIRYDWNVPAAELRAPVVIATSVGDCARLMSGTPELADRLRSVKQSPLMAVTRFYDRPTGPQAFGCLVPRGQGIRVLGVLLNHAIFPSRGPKFSETWIYGGATDSEAPSLQDEEVHRLIDRERKILFDREDQAVDARIVRWAEGLPHYDLTLENVLSDLRAPRGIWFHGNWLGGIGLSKILERSELLAAEIAREIKKGER